MDGTLSKTSNPNDQNTTKRSKGKGKEKETAPIQPSDPMVPESSEEEFPDENLFANPLQRMSSRRTNKFEIAGIERNDGPGPSSTSARERSDRDDVHSRNNVALATESRRLPMLRTDPTSSNTTEYSPFSLGSSEPPIKYHKGWTPYSAEIWSGRRKSSLSNEVTVEGLEHLAIDEEEPNLYSPRRIGSEAGRSGASATDLFTQGRGSGRPPLQLEPVLFHNPDWSPRQVKAQTRREFNDFDESKQVSHVEDVERATERLSEWTIVGSNRDEESTQSFPSTFRAALLGVIFSPTQLAELNHPKTLEVALRRFRSRNDLERRFSDTQVLLICRTLAEIENMINELREFFDLAEHHGRQGCTDNNEEVVEDQRSPRRGSTGMTTRPERNVIIGRDLSPSTSNTLIPDSESTSHHHSYFSQPATEMDSSMAHAGNSSNQEQPHASGSNRSDADVGPSWAHQSTAFGEHLPTQSNPSNIEEFGSSSRSARSPEHQALSQEDSGEQNQIQDAASTQIGDSVHHDSSRQDSDQVDAEEVTLNLNAPSSRQNDHAPSEFNPSFPGITPYVGIMTFDGAENLTQIAAIQSVYANRPIYHNGALPLADLTTYFLTSPPANQAESLLDKVLAQVGCSLNPSDHTHWEFSSSPPDGSENDDNFVEDAQLVNEASAPPCSGDVQQEIDTSPVLSLRSLEHQDSFASDGRDDTNQSDISGPSASRVDEELRRRHGSSNWNCKVTDDGILFNLLIGALMPKYISGFVQRYLSIETLGDEEEVQFSPYGPCTTFPHTAFSPYRGNHKILSGQDTEGSISTALPPCPTKENAPRRGPHERPTFHHYEKLLRKATLRRKKRQERTPVDDILQDLCERAAMEPEPHIRKESEHLSTISPPESPVFKIQCEGEFPVLPPIPSPLNKTPSSTPSPHVFPAQWSSLLVHR